jgi:RHS repeat-associated protein
MHLSNHLGNVLVTVSDRKLAEGTEGSTATGYRAEVLFASDYYPFGMQMPGREFSQDEYRYGFNGMEKDDEWKGEGNSYDFGARIYDSRIGRWLSVDPMAKEYPRLTDYCFVGNNPIRFIDPDGKRIIPSDVNGTQGESGNSTQEVSAAYLNDALHAVLTPALANWFDKTWGTDSNGVSGYGTFNSVSEKQSAAAQFQAIINTTTDQNIKVFAAGLFEAVLGDEDVMFTYFANDQDSNGSQGLRGDSYSYDQGNKEWSFQPFLNSNQGQQMNGTNVVGNGGVRSSQGYLLQGSDAWVFSSNLNFSISRDAEGTTEGLSMNLPTVNNMTTNYVRTLQTIIVANMNGSTGQVDQNNASALNQVGTRLSINSNLRNGVVGGPGASVLLTLPRGTRGNLDQSISNTRFNYQYTPNVGGQK